MAALTPSQKFLASVGAAALGGSALLMLLTGNLVAVADAGATAANASSSPFAAQIFRSAKRLPRPACRTCCFVLAQTEVPRAEMSAGYLRASLRGHRAATMGRPRVRRLQNHNRKRARSGLF